MAVAEPAQPGPGTGAIQSTGIVMRTARVLPICPGGFRYLLFRNHMFESEFEIEIVSGESWIFYRYVFVVGYKTVVF